MAPDKTEQVLIRVTPETKEEWAQEAEDRGFRGLSGFVRFAVNNEIDGRAAEGGTVEKGDEARDDLTLEDAVEAIEEAKRDMDDRLRNVETAVGSLHDELENADGGTVAPELVTEHLPSVKLRRMRDDVEDPSSVPPEERYRRPTDEEIAAEAKTPEEIADEIGVPTPPVRRTLEKMALKSERVDSHEDENGKQRYFANV